MTISWLPFVCEDPPGDAYYACFQALAGGDGGVPEGGPTLGGSDGGAAGISLQPGTDLTPLLPSGPSFTFQMPADAVSAHAPVPGTTPYGIAILFNVACAGHLELVPLDPNDINPQQVPVGCFDASGNQLGPDDWVLGYTRVYAYEADAGEGGGPVTNGNPTVTSVDVNGQTLPVIQEPSTPQVYSSLGFTSSRCDKSSPDPCQQIPLGPIVPSSAWELTQQTDVDGNPLHEELWADFYSSIGTFADDARLVYDATTGLVGDASTTDDKWTPPTDAGDGFVWIVVHDDRGGASWVTIPVHVQ
jgi:hypothetical protein